eukprot:3683238-Rhodomonas_salina.3
MSVMTTPVTLSRMESATSGATCSPTNSSEIPTAPDSIWTLSGLSVSQPEFRTPPIDHARLRPRAAYLNKEACH